MNHRILFVFAFALCCFMGQAQEKKIVKKSISIEKSEDGTSTKTKKVIEKEIITDAEEVEIEVDASDISETSQKIKIVIEKDGEREELEWDGEGEMPAEMKKMMEEHEIHVMDMEDMKEEDVDWTMKSEESNRPFLGVMIDVDEGINGAKVDEVVEGSAAQMAGLKEGDIITNIDGRSIRDFDDLISVLEDKSANQAIGMTYLRDGKEYNTKTVLTEQAQNKFKFKEGKEQKKIIKKKIERQ